MMPRHMSSHCGLRNLAVHRLAFGTDTRVDIMRIPVNVFQRAFLSSKAANEALFGVYGAEEMIGEVATLDSFERAHHIKRIDFTVCDVEGAELEVPLGGAKTLRGFLLAVLREIEDRHMVMCGYSDRDVFSYLAGTGYRAAPGLLGDDFVPRDKPEVRWNDNVLMSSDRQPAGRDTVPEPLHPQLVA